MLNERNTVVRNPRDANFGLGRVIAVDAKTAHVFFPLRNPTEALRFAAHATFEVVEHDESETFQWLAHLPAFRWNKERWVLPADVITHHEAVAKFRRIFPRGFEDDDYLEGERGYKVAAHERWVSSLGSGQAEALIAAGDFEELRDRLKRVIQPLNLLASFESSALGDGLKDVEQARPFLEAVVRFSQGPEAGKQVSFEALVDATTALPAPRSPVLRWPIVTLLPFCADPNLHAFVKPQVTKAAAARVGFEIHYDSRPNWKTYEAVLELSRFLNRRLKADGARDFIDAQTFIWAVVKYDDPLTTPP